MTSKGRYQRILDANGGKFPVTTEADVQRAMKKSIAKTRKIIYEKYPELENRDRKKGSPTDPLRKSARRLRNGSDDGTKVRVAKPNTTWLNSLNRNSNRRKADS
jgi:hypothetical protein